MQWLALALLDAEAATATQLHDRLVAAVRDSVPVAGLTARLAAADNGPRPDRLLTESTLALARRGGLTEADWAGRGRHWLWWTSAAGHTVLAAAESEARS